MASKTCAMLTHDTSGFKARDAFRIYAGEKLSLRIGLETETESLDLLRGTFTVPDAEVLATMMEISPFSPPLHGGVNISPHVYLVRVKGFEGEIMVPSVSVFVTV